MVVSALYVYLMCVYVKTRLLKKPLKMKELGRLSLLA